jgi:hypothetical protein
MCIFRSEPTRSSVIGAGRWPQWVSKLQAGLPYLANGEIAVMYPFQAPLMLVDPPRAAGLLLWLHTVLSMLTIYGFLSIGLRLNRAPAIGEGISGSRVFLAHLRPAATEGGLSLYRAPVLRGLGDSRGGSARLNSRVGLPDDGWVFLADTWYPDGPLRCTEKQ